MCADAERGYASGFERECPVGGEVYGFHPCVGVCVDLELEIVSFSEHIVSVSLRGAGEEHVFERLRFQTAVVDVKVDVFLRCLSVAENSFRSVIVALYLSGKELVRFNGQTYYFSRFFRKR